MLSKKAKKKLVHLADSLDSKGFKKEANEIDDLLNEMESPIREEEVIEQFFGRDNIVKLLPFEIQNRINHYIDNKDQRYKLMKDLTDDIFSWNEEQIKENNTDYYAWCDDVSDFLYGLLTKEKKDMIDKAMEEETKGRRIITKDDLKKLWDEEDSVNRYGDDTLI